MSKHTTMSSDILHTRCEFCASSAFRDQICILHWLPGPLHDYKPHYSLMSPGSPAHLMFPYWRVVFGVYWLDLGPIKTAHSHMQVQPMEKIHSPQLSTILLPIIWFRLLITIRETLSSNPPARQSLTNRQWARFREPNDNKTILS